LWQPPAQLVLHCDGNGIRKTFTDEILFLLHEAQQQQHYGHFHVYFTSSQQSCNILFFVSVPAGYLQNWQGPNPITPSPCCSLKYTWLLSRPKLSMFNALTVANALANININNYLSILKEYHFTPSYQTRFITEQCT